MKYLEIYKMAINALNKSIRTMERFLLPSIWSNKGFGWHEQWKNSPTCGVYASCQGLMIIKQIKGYDPEYKNLYEKVYSNNLLLLFDKEHLIKDDGTSFKKSIQRGKAIGSTYKLSWFVETSFINKNNSSVVEHLKLKLIGLCDFDGMFFSADCKKTKSLLATAVAFKSLSNYNELLQDLEQTRSLFVSNIINFIEKGNCSVIDAILSLWALSNSINIDTAIVESAIQKILLENKANNEIYTEKYVLNNGMRDSYSVNLKLIFIQSILSFINNGMINIYNSLGSVVSQIYNIATCILEKNIYYENCNIDQALFWNNYYALDCLRLFTMALDANQFLKDVEYMIINPQYFIKTDFMIDPLSVTIIMPFSVGWADTVYNTFCQAIPGFKLWRSKEECTADAIMQNVWEHINSCDFVIADCTGKNPNVFYELGIAHTLGKPVFMCAQSIADLPFDINYIRSFIYDLSEAGLKKLQSDLLLFSQNFNSK